MKLTKHQLAQSSGITVETLDVWIEQEWLIPEPTASGPLFSDVDMARTRLILELKTDIGANDEGIGVILHLIDQLHGMRGALERLRGELR